MPDTPVALRRPLPPAGAAVAAVVLTVFTWHISSLVAQAGLDPSWQVALHLAQIRGVPFGPDFVWTYGPLGFLAYPLAVGGGGTLAPAVAFVFLTQTTLGYVLVYRAGVAFGAPLAIVMTYAVLLLPFMPADFVSLLVAALALWALAEPAGPVSRLLPLGGGVLVGIALLVKTNTGMAALIVLLVACAATGARRLAVAVGTVVVVFLALWVALGNAIADIPEWSRLSVSLVTGYSAAMQREQSALGPDYAFAAVVAVALALATWAGTVHRPRRLRVAVSVVVFGYAFAAFKESFVRHDTTHAPAFFAAACVLLLCVGARGRALAAVAVGVLVAVLAGGRAGELPVTPTASPGRALAHIRDAADPGRWSALAADSRADQRRSYQLPRAAVALLRGHTVHVDPWEAALVSAYRLPWRPLPVPQTYSAYTSTLDERNAAFLASRDAPQRILREDTPEQVNGRDRPLEAPATYRGILCNYRQLLVTGRWQVLARGSRCTRPRLLGTIAVAPGKPVAVPEGEPDDLVVAKVKFHDSLLNRLRGLVYKPEEAVVSLGGGPFTPVAADVVRDGIVVHVPGNLGYDPRFGGAIDWRSVAAGGLRGNVTVTFEAYRVLGAGPPPAGERPRPVLPRYRLEHVAGRDRIVTPDGRTLPVAPGGGFVDYGYVRRRSLVLQGWAADVVAGAPARTILVFADGALLFAGPPNVPRPDVAAALRKPGLRGAGYSLLVPVADVRDADARRDVRIFSLVGGRALEVEYPLSYGWRRR
jgi:hypothetical protein